MGEGQNLIGEGRVRAEVKGRARLTVESRVRE